MSRRTSRRCVFLLWVDSTAGWNRVNGATMIDGVDSIEGVDVAGKVAVVHLAGDDMERDRFEDIAAALREAGAVLVVGLAPDTDLSTLTMAEFAEAIVALTPPSITVTEHAGYEQASLPVAIDRMEVQEQVQLFFGDVDAAARTRADLAMLRARLDGDTPLGDPS